MPSMGRNSGGRSRATGKDTKSRGGVTLGRKPSGLKRKQKATMDPDDLPLNPDVQADDSYAEADNPAPAVAVVEPFVDGLISPHLDGLTVVPRAGGEEVAVLHDFLLMFAKTGTFIGTISSKTSFMKKAGGRLL